MTDKQTILKFLQTRKGEFLSDFNIVKIGLFGSFSTGNQKQDSDIDIVYHIKQGSSLSYKQFIALESLLQKEFDCQIDLINYNYFNPLIKSSCQNHINYA